MSELTEGMTEINFEELVLLNEESVNNDNKGIDFTLEDLAKNGDETKEEEAKIEEKAVEEPAKVEEPKTENKSIIEGKDYSSIAKKLLEEGDWKDALIDKDGAEIKLSEIESLDEETFLGIWKEQKKFAKEDLDKEYIPIKGIDENKLRLINIVKNGGDLKEIFETEAQLKKPFEGIDLENQHIQQNIFYNNLLRRGLSEDDAKDLVIKSTKDLTLDTKVKTIVTEHQNQYDENLKKIEKETIENQAKEQEKIKEYKKSMNTLYKEEGIEDSLSKVLVEAATKFDKESGQLYIDTVYEKMMEDPKEAKELVFFMLEREKYLAKKGASIKRDVQVSNLKKINIIQDTSKQASKVPEVEEPKDVFSAIVLD